MRWTINLHSSFNVLEERQHVPSNCMDIIYDETYSFASSCINKFFDKHLRLWAGGTATVLSPLHTGTRTGSHYTLCGLDLARQTTQAGWRGCCLMALSLRGTNSEIRGIHSGCNQNFTQWWKRCHPSDSFVRAWSGGFRIVSLWRKRAGGFRLAF